MFKYLPTIKLSVFSRQSSDKKAIALSKRSESKGFTLIELMVVITIIAFLSVIGAAAYSSAQKNARDSRRRADIEAIASALEANKNVDGTYKLSTDTSIYANGEKPTDPDGAGAYVYTVLPSSGTPSTFTACAKLEGNYGNSSSVGDGTVFTSASGAVATYYCRKNQQ